MIRVIDSLLDILFVVLHAALILFNVLGWIPRRTRRAHLVTIGATLASWTLLGVLYGFGYCPLTDWHWDVKRRLGERDLPSSWVEYYLERLTSVDWSASTVDALVLGVTVVALACSLWLNLRPPRR
jgi:hypothetical protein